jgi:hypothetical protein
MSYKIHKFSLSFSVLLLLSVDANASDCDGDFSVKGNLLTGESYKMVAALRSVSADGAFQSVHQHLSKEGWNIRTVDNNARVLSALNNRSARPLNVTVEQDQNGASITLAYSSPAGAFTPTNTVKEGFCNIVTAASERGGSTTVRSTSQVDQGRHDPEPLPTNSPPGVCMASACIGMTLNDASKLNLKPQGPRSKLTFSYTNGRQGIYGIDKDGKIVSIDSTSSIDNAWIKQYTKKIRTLCSAPNQLVAEMVTSDGTPIDLVFTPAFREGKSEFILNLITRMLPNNLSDSELQRIEEQLRTKYGQAFIPEKDISRTINANNGVMSGPSVILNSSDIQLRGPSNGPVQAKLMEQPQCSNRINLD